MTPKLLDLVRILRQLFLFDRADLDFGLYRHMTADDLFEYISKLWAMRETSHGNFIRQKLLPRPKSDPIRALETVVA